MHPRTLDELAEEQRHGRPTRQEDWARARDYERSLLGPETVWPAENDVYTCLSECPTAFLTHWNAPFTGGGKTAILPGEKIRIQELWEDKPVIVAAVPIDPSRIESRVVPVADRTHPNYAGFSFSIRTRDLIAHFKRDG